MVHLLPLPGAPRFAGSIDRVVARAVEDATVLAESGFPALMVENFGDAPFFADSVPDETIAGITVAVREVAAATRLPLGVNVLRNDGSAAVAIASATGARFVRINVLTGMMYTDQGPIVGRAAEVSRLKEQLSPGLEIWADVMVKHATPPPGLEPGQATRDTFDRGGADAIIVSGSGTGQEPDLALARQIAESLPPDARLVVGSGATPDNLPKLMDVADGAIVGSSLKTDGEPLNPVDRLKADSFIQAASALGIL